MPGAGRDRGWRPTRGRGGRSAPPLPLVPLQPGPRLGQHLAQRRRDEVDLLLAADERRRELDDRVPAVVGAADETGFEERAGQVAAQQALRLLFVEGEARLLVLDELDPVEEPGAAYVAHDREVVEPLQRRAEGRFGRPYMLEDLLPLEHIEVGQGDGTAHRVAGEGDA